MGLNWKVLFLNINFVKTEIMMARILNFTERTSHKNPCFETRPGILAGCLTILQLWNGGGEKGENASEKNHLYHSFECQCMTEMKKRKKKKWVGCGGCAKKFSTPNFLQIWTIFKFFGSTSLSGKHPFIFRNLRLIMTVTEHYIQRNRIICKI